MIDLRPWVLLVVSQLAVVVAGTATAYISLLVPVLLAWPATLIAGIVLAVKGHGIAFRAGMPEKTFTARFVATVVLGLIVWTVVIAIGANLPWELGHVFGWAIVAIPGFAVFSAGWLAYFRLRPFDFEQQPMHRVRQLATHDGVARVGMRATSDQVAEAERALGFRLPASFVEMLTSWGEIEVGATKIFGIPPAGGTSFVDVTLAGREQLGLPRHFVLCASYPNDLHVCLDTFGMRNDDAPVVLWHGATRTVTATLAPTFGHFLREQLELKRGAGPG